MSPRGTDLRTVAPIASLEVVGSWFSVGVAVARPAGLPLARLGLKLGRGLALLVSFLQGSGFLEFLLSRAVLWTFG